jgi:hypothetical protein
VDVKVLSSPPESIIRTVIVFICRDIVLVKEESMSQEKRLFVKCHSGICLFVDRL